MRSFFIAHNASGEVVGWAECDGDAAKVQLQAFRNLPFVTEVVVVDRETKAAVEASPSKYHVLSGKVSEKPSDSGEKV